MMTVIVYTLSEKSISVKQYLFKGSNCIHLGSIRAFHSTVIAVNTRNLGYKCTCQMTKGKYYAEMGRSFAERGE